MVTRKVYPTVPKYGTLKEPVRLKTLLIIYSCSVDVYCGLNESIRALIIYRHKSINHAWLCIKSNDYFRLSVVFITRDNTWSMINNLRFTDDTILPLRLRECLNELRIH